ncbi:armadillo repeat-containing protein 12 [Microcaecilia unicolor]|uniref:Armadillo repeat-containing protein 12 n=1 Tax=Microcaecilia unicolor TaxID=1415580 RepID=A0A6P7ZW50_9AMPH|nr:armadillo repeat-containing protein 12 [Microcaecilia unicolor]
MEKFLDPNIRRNVLFFITGAGTAYLAYKVIRSGISGCLQNRDASNAGITRFSIKRDSKKSKSGELRRLLNLLKQQPDNFTKGMLLHGITRCIYLLECEAKDCTNDDINVIGSLLNDEEKGIKIQALNALNAFASLEIKQRKIQEYVPRVIELVTTIWDSDLHIAGLKLLNLAILEDRWFLMLRRGIPSFMEILQAKNNLAQLQVLKLLITLSQKEELLYDILNCQVFPDFLNLFSSQLPGNVICQMLLLVQSLNVGINNPRYQSVSWEYNEESLYEALFGQDSRLPSKLLSLILHPEEDVQRQVCQVILCLEQSKSNENICEIQTSSSST